MLILPFPSICNIYVRVGVFVSMFASCWLGDETSFGTIVEHRLKQAFFRIAGKLTLRQFATPAEAKFATPAEASIFSDRVFHV